MRVEIFTFCDFAQDNGGKLVIVGGCDSLTVPSFPYVHPRLFVAARVRFSLPELGLHRFKLAFADLDGREVLPPVEGEVNLRGFRKATAALNAALSLPELRLDKETTVTATLEVDGKELAFIPLYVEAAKPR